MKKDVMHQLPPKTRQMVVLDPGSVKVNKIMKQSHRLVDQMKVIKLIVWAFFIWITLFCC